MYSHPPATVIFNYSNRQYGQAYLICPCYLFFCHPSNRKWNNFLAHAHWIKNIMYSQTHLYEISRLLKQVLSCTTNQQSIGGVHGNVRGHSGVNVRSKLTIQIYNYGLTLTNIHWDTTFLTYRGITLVYNWYMSVLSRTDLNGPNWLPLSHRH